MKVVTESLAKSKKNAYLQGFFDSIKFKNSSGVKKREVHKQSEYNQYLQLLRETRASVGAVIFTFLQTFSANLYFL